jgi:hypothetical protein
MIDLRVVSINCGQKTYLDLLHKLLEQVHVPAECWVWHNCPYGIGTPVAEVSSWQYHQDLVIWMVLDSLISDHEHDPVRTPIPPVFAELESICRDNPDRRFILLTSQIGFDHIRTAQNLRVIDLPPDVSENILDFPPTTEHQIDPHRPVLFLNNSERQHRVIALCYLLSQRLDRYCRFTVGDSIGNRIAQFDRFQSYCFHNMPQLDLWAVMEQGWQYLKTCPNHNEYQDAVTEHGPNANLDNYTRSLMCLYSQTCVEIVGHSIFAEPTPHITEKNFQSLWGRNIPLYMAPAGTVAWMRDHGFDMFDDVIDHGYDSITNPVERIMAVFDLNRDLLTDSDRIIFTWYQNQDRLDYNIAHMPGFFAECETETEREFVKVLQEWNAGG